MNFANANKFHRKSGVAQWRDLRLLPLKLAAVGEHPVVPCGTPIDFSRSLFSRALVLKPGSSASYKGMPFFHRNFYAEHPGRWLYQISSGPCPVVENRRLVCMVHRQPRHV